MSKKSTYEELEQKVRDLEGYKEQLILANQKLETLHSITSLKGADIQTISNHVLNSICKMTESRYGFYGFLDDDASDMIIYAWTDAALKDCSVKDRPKHFPIKKAGVWAEAIRNKKPYILNDYESYQGKKGAPEGHVKINNLLVLPILKDGSVISVAAVANKPLKYDQDDITQLETFLFGIQALVESKQAEEKAREGEKLLANFVSNLPGTAYQFTIDRNGTFRFEYIGKNCADLFGISANEILGDANLVFDIIPQPDADKVNEAIMRSAKSMTPYNIEHRVIKRNGETVWIHASSIPRNRDDDEIVWDGIGLNITERKQFEMLIEKRNTDLRLAQRIASIGTWTLDPEIGVPEWSEEIYRIYERDPSLGPYPLAEYRNLYKGKWLERFNNAIQGAIKDGIPYDIELRLELPSGNVKWVHAICEPEPKIGPKGHKVRGTIQDITEKRQALIALEETKNRYESIYQNAQVGLSRTRISDGKVLECNRRMADIFGYDNADEFIAKGVLSDRYVDKGTREKALAEITKYGFIQNKEARFYRKDGKIIWARFDSRIFPEYGYMEDVVIEITQQKESEEKLLRQQKAISLNNKIANVFLTSSRDDIFANTLDVVLETLESPFGYFGYIDDNRNLNCPSMTRDIWDKCDVPDKSIVFPNEIWGGVWGESLKTAKTVISNGGLKLPEGHIQLECAMAVPIIHHDEVIGQFVVADKESGYRQYEKFLLESAASQTAPILNNLLEKEAQEREHKKMQARIEQAQKMESVGNLAGGIAHDFNNILFPIVGMSELLLEDFPPDSPEYENAKEIFKAGKRGSDLVKQILAFSRQSEQKKIPIRIQQILKEVMNLSRSTIPVNIDITQDIQSNCSMVQADPTQVHQIAMNLITNAYHAVERKGGEIFVGLREVEIEPEQLSESDLSPGRYALLSVSDTGSGIDPSILNKIFEPYFTTKEQGKGTGLGLAVVYGIVKEHHGDIKVYSELGKGTTFNVYLPIMTKAENPAPAEENENARIGYERILLVDDEEPIAKLEKQMLERLGYTVTMRVNSLEALAAFKAKPESFDLVISDMTMPQMTGDQLAKELISIRADIPIIICTGFSERLNQEKAAAIGVKGFLMKPIIKSELAKMVRKVLDEAKDSDQG